jgi:C1A family cysteine protease
MRKSHYMGCLEPSAERVKTFPKAEKPSLSISLATSVDLSSNFPSPGDQGNQGSCTAWAVAYAYKTFQEKLDQEWDLTTTDHQFSPAYVYNQINDGTDSGAYIDDAMKIILDQGVCSLAVMPYSDTDYTTQPTTAQKAAASLYKSKSWGVLTAGSTTEIKTHLAAGDAVVVGIPVYADFDNLSSSNQVYDTISGTLEGYHALCLVGYNDSKSAFKFINSWGTSWGLNGYGYVSYNLLKNWSTIGYVMVDITEES